MIAASIFLCAALAAAPASLPVIYTTDLYHPHNDPDDHYDLMTLFALSEFDVRAVVIDRGETGKDRPGFVALEQLAAMTGRKPAAAAGLIANLAAPDDTVEFAPEEEQGGVKLILETLAQSEQPVTIITAGSLRDVAAAYNRAPGLFREKTARLYVNAGWMGETREWNAGLDVHAYTRILESGLPVYWAPCFGGGGYQTYWKFTQADMLEKQRTPIQNFFLYMLTKTPKEQADPVEYLRRPVDPEAVKTFYPQPRNMWCTAPFLHAARRPDATFDFVDTRVSIRADGTATLAGKDEPDARVLKTFRVIHPAEYAESMTKTLSELFSGIALNESRLFSHE